MKLLISGRQACYQKVFSPKTFHLNEHKSEFAGICLNRDSCMILFMRFVVYNVNFPFVYICLHCKLFVFLL